MLTYQLNEDCVGCFKGREVLCQLDHVLTLFGKRMRNNKAFLLNKPLSFERLKILLYYKDILSNLVYDPLYYGPQYPYEIIESRIKELLNGL